MIITTLNLTIIGLSIMGWVMVTAPEECPRKYMKTVEQGGVLEYPTQIYDFCSTAPLPYQRYYWVLKEEQD